MATTAKTREEVDKMSKADRLWDSLSHSYGKRAEKIENQYNKAFSQTNNELTRRGMQRSGYGLQTLANVDKQKLDALGENDSDLIADYENRLQQLDAAEDQRAFQTSEREAQQAWHW